VTIILILGLVILAWAIGVLVHAILRPRAASVGMVNQIGHYGFTGDVVLDEDDDQRSIDRVAGAIGNYLGKRLSWFREEELRVRLVSAGMYSVTPSRFLGYQALSAIALMLLWLWLGGLFGYSVFALVVFAVVAAVLGWLAPMGFVWLQTRKRRDEIDYELPELIDLLVVAIEAGLSLPAAIRLASSQIKGPLGEELRLTLQENTMGLSTTQTLENLGVRADTPGMRVFIRSIAQGETLGISIGQVMRNLSLEMRKRRKAAAEERAQKAPVKMVFPLVLLIFPAIFIVLLLPALLSISDVFGNL
jgi:tight adherence protein C